ncbi:MAG: hypothetical protein R2720_11780 [Candidatus Nanopelagicales bacterium]
MPAWSTYSYIFGPLVALAIMAVMILLLRWAFGTGGSLVARDSRPGGSGDYGLMVPVAGAEDYIRAEMQRHMLEDAGLRVNLVRTTDGPRLMVWESDRDRALELLSRGDV